MRSYQAVSDHELEGFVLMVPTEFGGRSTSVHSGYRGQFFWHINGIPGTDWDAESFFECEAVEPGEACRIKIKLKGSIAQIGKQSGMPVGRQFCLREGARVVAVGVITKSKMDY